MRGDYARVILIGDEVYTKDGKTLISEYLNATNRQRAAIENCERVSPFTP